jgi:osmotically inducible lipoprotein OsmB
MQRDVGQEQLIQQPRVTVIPIPGHRLQSGGCVEMLAQDKNTAIGAGVGTVGGAVVGGIIGHEVNKSNVCTLPRTEPGSCSP